MKNEITQKIGRRMADIRKSKQLTQEQLANLAHVSPSEVSRIERGINSASVETLLNFCNALDVGLDSLLYDFFSRENPVRNPDTKQIMALIDSLDEKHFKYIKEIIIIYKASHQD
ncbi:MAG: helix-turn-helix transcriptional regulator [Eubacteriales bacterium]|nr:helix-turn-helix transcriptional regulator [Eubacteriales bacterium]